MKTTVYHNPRCRKSRMGLDLVKAKTDEIEIIDYLNNGISPATIKKLSQQLNLNVSDMIRTQEDYYRKVLKGKIFSEEEWMQIISENPKLLKRPIVAKGNKAIIAESVEEVEKLFSRDV
jgi:arsenate reductase (glutaredoxin)